MARPVNIGNELAFFEIEKAGGTEYSVDGVDYDLLFDLYYLIEAVNDLPFETDQAIEEILLHYAIHDAKFSR